MNDLVEELLLADVTDILRCTTLSLGATMTADNADPAHVVGLFEREVFNGVYRSHNTFTGPVHATAHAVTSIIRGDATLLDASAVLAMKVRTADIRRISMYVSGAARRTRAVQHAPGVYD